MLLAACDETDETLQDAADSLSPSIGDLARNARVCPNHSYVTIAGADGAGDTHLDLLAADESSGGAWLGGTIADPITLGKFEVAPSGGTDAFLAKLDACGAPIWARSFGATGDETALSLQTDADGNAYVLGTLDGTVDFGSGPISGEGPGFDAFVLKLDADGDVVWSKHIHTTDGVALTTNITTDKEGNVLVLGHLEGAVSFGDATVDSSTVTGFLARIDASGATDWAIGLGLGSDLHPLDVETTSAGEIFVAGEDARGVGIFAQSITTEGVVSWTQSFRASGQFLEQFFDMTVAADDSPILVGRGFLKQGGDESADTPYFVAKLGDLGEPTWVQFGDQPFTRVAAHSDGSFVLGTERCEDVSKPKPTGCAVAISRRDADGNLVGSHDVIGEASLEALDLDTNGRPLIQGLASGKVRVGGASAIADERDFYVGRLLH